MKPVRNTLASLLLGAAAAAFAIPALARPPMPPEAGMPPPMFEGLPMEDECPLPPFMHGLKLSEAQRDKVFDILDAQAPQLRRHARALRKSQEALRALALSAHYDEAQARALADSLAKAVSEIALLHAQVDHQLIDLLTPEQRRGAEAEARPECLETRPGASLPDAMTHPAGRQLLPAGRTRFASDRACDHPAPASARPLS